MGSFWKKVPLHGAVRWHACATGQKVFHRDIWENNEFCHSAPYSKVNGYFSKGEHSIMKGFASLFKVRRLYQKSIGFPDRPMQFQRRLLFVFTTPWADSANKTLTSSLFFPENRLLHVMPIVSLGNNLLKETICMKFQSLISGQNKTIFKIVVCWNFYPENFHFSVVKFSVHTCIWIGMFS